MTYRRCKCPVWVFGSVDGFRVRKALDTVNWQHAEEMLRELDPHKRPTKVSLLDAEARFISDCESRKLTREMVAKYKLMLAEMKKCLGAVKIREITVDDLGRYRETWKAAPITAVKKLEHLRAFLKFYVDRGWCTFNPAVPLKKPKGRFRPTLPFTKEGVEKILWATEVYPIEGICGESSRKRIRAFVPI